MSRSQKHCKEMQAHSTKKIISVHKCGRIRLSKVWCTFAQKGTMTHALIASNSVSNSVLYTVIQTTLGLSVLARTDANKLKLAG